MHSLTSSHQEAFLENNCTFNNMQIILLNIFPLRRSLIQTVNTGHQRDSSRIKHVKNQKKQFLLHFDPVAMA